MRACAIRRCICFSAKVFARLAVLRVSGAGGLAIARAIASPTGIGVGNAAVLVMYKHVVQMVAQV